MRGRNGHSLPLGSQPEGAIIRDHSQALQIFEIIDDAKAKIAAAFGVDPDRISLELFIADEPHDPDDDA
jgi:hypothetical protein